MIVHFNKLLNFLYFDKRFFYLLFHMYRFISRIRITNGILRVIREDWLLSFTYNDEKCKWVFFLSSLHQDHNHHLSISSNYICVYVSYSINISRRTRKSICIYTYIYMYIYIYTVEGVCSRLIVDYLRGTCEWMVGCVLLCVIVIKEEKRKEKKTHL